MQFTDIAFALFMSVFFCIYWFALRKDLRWQNVWLLSASYIFYGWWDWRFLLLIILTSASSFSAALLFEKYGKKLFPIFNIILNLGILVIFKYFNFFSENIYRLFNLMGYNLDWFTLDVLLPVGISFYTFMAIGYSVDVMRRAVKPTRDIIGFFTFIAFFPQLMAGPIESAQTLLPQILRKRVWNTAQAVTGLRMILYGVMKKVCVADMLAIYVERIFNEPEISPVNILIGGIIFTLELYCDFSAYSEIARGCASLLGIELMVNFRFPFFSRNIVEFWQRWHISLMVWFKKYLYIPLGGNRRGKFRTMVNYSIVFLLSGLWHGASWNFIIWGAYWAVCYVAARSIFRISLKNHGEISLRSLPEILVTFGVVAFGFYMFRCNDTMQVVDGLKNLWIYIAFFGGLWLLTNFARPYLACLDSKMTAVALTVASLACVALIVIGEWVYLLKMWWFAAALIVAVIEWHDRDTDYPFSLPPRRRFLRLALYWIMGALIVLSEPSDMNFIYYQF